MLNEVTRLTKGDFSNVTKYKKEDNCLNCKDRNWCATYTTYKSVLKCKHWNKG